VTFDAARSRTTNSFRLRCAAAVAATRRENTFGRRDRKTGCIKPDRFETIHRQRKG